VLPRASISVPPVGAATPRRQREVQDHLSRGRMPLPRMLFDAYRPPWERQRRDASAKSGITSVGAGCPSHECCSTRTGLRGSGNAATPAPSPGSPESGQKAPPTNAVRRIQASVGAAPPRRQRQVQDHPSRGRMPLPQMLFDAYMNPPWERHRRDASAKSRTTRVGARRPSHECYSTHTCPRGSGTAATPAPSPGSPESRQNAPPTNAVRRTRASRGSGTAATPAPSSGQPESGQNVPPTNAIRRIHAPVGSAPPRRQRLVQDHLSRGRKPLPRMLFDAGAKSRTTQVGAGRPSCRHDCPAAIVQTSAQNPAPAGASPKNTMGRTLK